MKMKNLKAEKNLQFSVVIMEKQIFRCEIMSNGLLIPSGKLFGER